MERQRKVALYGNSLVLASVGRSLEKYPRLDVVSLDATLPLDPPALAALDPDVLLLDLSAVSLEAALALARGRPELLLIGLDPAGERLLVLSGRQARRLSTEDLVRLIDRRPRGRARPPRRDTALDTRAPDAIVARSTLGTTST